MKPLEMVMDALDLESFLVCRSEEEGREMGLQLMKDLGFNDVDVVFAQFEGPGVRIRLRAYVHRSGDQYTWLEVR